MAINRRGRGDSEDDKTLPVRDERELVARKECNRARIEELWARHRRTVRQQAELDFMPDVVMATPQ